MKLIAGVVLGMMMCVGSAFGQDTYKVCDESKIYSSGHPQLNKMYDGKVPVAKTVPQWEKGIDSLSSFFGKHVKTVVSKQTPIQRVMLTFVVDCNGNPGDFQFINKENYPIQKDIKAACENFMEKWEPATHKGNNVDCRVVVVFSVANSKFTVRWKDEPQ